jgi:hypothetical protein
MRSGSMWNGPPLARTELHGGEHVMHRLRKCLLPLFRKPVADREQRISACGEPGTPELKRAARTPLPATAMHRNERWKFPRARRQVEVAEERHAVMARIGDTGAGLDRLCLRHDLYPLYRAA